MSGMGLICSLFVQIRRTRTNARARQAERWPREEMGWIEQQGVNEAESWGRYRQTTGRTTEMEQDVTNKERRTGVAEQGIIRRTPENRQNRTRPEKQGKNRAKNRADNRPNIREVAEPGSPVVHGQGVDRIGFWDVRHAISMSLHAKDADVRRRPPPDERHRSDANGHRHFARAARAGDFAFFQEFSPVIFNYQGQCAFG